MLKRRILLCLLSAMAATLTTLAQNTGTINGTVWDYETNTPLAGASVMIDGTTLGTATDKEGNFTLTGVSPGTHNIIITYVGYEEATRQAVVSSRATIKVDIFLYSSEIIVGEVVVFARANRENENTLLLEQKEALVVVQTVGALEMSRKGTGDAEAAVAQVSGVSKQEGVKNVFVRGLGDRYNMTLLNGFPVPSEDPEYKNIALDFFGTDIIQNIGVSKVFSAESNGDVVGAVVDIHSKQLQGNDAFSVSVDGGVNSRAIGADFLELDGVDYFGQSSHKQPAAGTFDFANRLDPAKVKMPVNHSYALSGGKLFKLRNGDPLSFFAVASHSTDYAFSKESVRGATIDGTVYEDQSGEKSSIGVSQLVLANVDYRPRQTNMIAYNFMMLHANEQYVGQYYGMDGGSYPVAPYLGFMRRQQSNDNLLLTNQLMSKWNIGERFRLDLGVSYNTIKGLEPDRRENFLQLEPSGKYSITGSDSQRRVFSELREQDLNLRAGLRYKLSPNHDIEKSNVTVGYKGRFVDDSFKSVIYIIGVTEGLFDVGNLHLDDYYNYTAYEQGDFRMKRVADNRYKVLKYVNSAYAELTHQLTEKLAANVGFQIDMVDLTVDHNVQLVPPGKRSIDKNYYLPSINLRYDIDESSSLRLGASKSYILPQPKEISPYEYINIGFSSQGNQNIKPSDSYNIDLKWDYYPTPSELIAVGVFYKHITDPIGRVDVGNAAGTLTYDNISPKAVVAGVEFEMRKNLLDRGETKLTAGLNASYIYSNLELDIVNTKKRKTELEGASPVIVNADLSYNFMRDERSFTAALVANYTSDRINTLGTQGYEDTIEKGVVALSAVASYKFGNHWGVKFKAGNLLDPAYQTSRKYDGGRKKTILHEYKKGINVSLGVSFDL